MKINVSLKTFKCDRKQKLKIGNSETPKNIRNKNCSCETIIRGVWKLSILLSISFYCFQTSLFVSNLSWMFLMCLLSFKSTLCVSSGFWCFQSSMSQMYVSKLLSQVFNLLIFFTKREVSKISSLFCLNHFLIIIMMWQLKWSFVSIYFDKATTKLV